jgi:hypothetical protein
MGNALICGSDESTLNTSVGSCSIKHCNWGCFGAKKDDKNDKVEDEAMREINDAIRAELAAVEHAMRKHMLAGLRTYGDVIPVHILADDMKSPEPARGVTVRIKTIEA